MAKIGLEIHVYLITREKLFCRCKAVREKGLEINSYICPVCTGQPGAKPMLPNGAAVQKAVQVGLLLGCKINERLVWQRKHYSWPDLPKGYQNTLSGPYAFPVGVGGKFGGIGITEMHLEEDPAAWDPVSGRVDYNRSGLPLLEIVTEPEFTSSAEVGEWLGKLLHNLSYLRAVQPDAGIKVDVNVSTMRGGKPTERVEVKNVNSVENIKLVIEHELSRQEEEGSSQETRRWNPETGETVVMRTKENAADYRFVSDPDLQDVILDKTFVSGLRDEMPEPPEVKIAKLVKEHGLSKMDANVLAKHVEIVEFFESVASRVGGGFARDWVIVELQGMLNYNKTSLGNVAVSVEDFVELLEAVRDGKISVGQGKKIIQEWKDGSYSLSERGIEGKISDSGELEEVVQRVVENEKDAVAKYKAGDGKVINFLVGQVMKETGGRADFRVVKGLLEKVLG